MIPVSGGVRVYVAIRSVDCRKGHDGLAAVVQETLKLDRLCQINRLEPSSDRP